MKRIGRKALDEKPLDEKVLDEKWAHDADVVLHSIIFLKVVYY